MNKFSNLMGEVQAMQDSWGYDMLDAIQYIQDNKDQYPSEIRRELREFMFDGAKMFAPVKEIA
jgi:hypothetical protein